MREHADMVKSGLFANAAAAGPQAPALTRHNRQAIEIWNRAGGEIRWPELLYLFALHDIDDLRLMVDRLYALRDIYRG